MLEIEDLRVDYAKIRALRGVRLEVREGEFVAVLGRNGAGKSSLAKAIVGIVRPSGGRIVFQGQRIDGLPSHVICTRGIGYVPEGRIVFPNMTVRENLEVGAYSRRDGEVRRDLELLLDEFPELRRRERQLAGALSGGEQQMLAFARALMSRPRMVVMDEPSLGLAPLLVARVYEMIRVWNTERGLTGLLVEQNARMALKVAHRAVVLEAGSVVLEGRAEEVARHAAIVEAYMGV